MRRKKNGKNGNGTNDLAGIGEVELPNVEYATITSEQMGLNAEMEEAEEILTIE